MVLLSLMVGSINTALASAVPYVGGSIGINTITSDRVATGLVGSSILYDPLFFRGIPFSAFVGFGGALNQEVYLAGELTVTIATAEISDGGLKTSYGYGVSILPGVMLSDYTLAYIRLGLVRTRFSSENTTTSGMQLGIGMQTNVTQNVDLRGGYDFTAYRSFDNPFGRVSSPRSDAFNLALVYKFD